MYNQPLIEPLVKINEDPQLTWRATVLLMVANLHPLWSIGEKRRTAL